MAAGDQDGELGGTGQNGAAELRTGRQMMFSVVDYQQTRQRAYVVDDLLNGCLRGAAYAERSGQCTEHRRRSVKCPDGKPVDSVREARRLGGGVPDRDSGLADSGGSKERQEPGVVAFDELGHLAEFLVAADRLVGKHRKRR